MEEISKEKTLVLLKPDAIQKALIGKIIGRVESTGLKPIALKMVQVTSELAEQHYCLDETWAQSVYKKTKEKYDSQGLEMRHKDHLSLGKEIQSWNMSFLQEGPVVAMVWEGPHAVEIIRKIIGSTEPLSSQPGTIRADFASTESYKLADSESRVARNLIHASDSPENAKREISLWFTPEEIHSYKNISDFSIK